MGVPFHRIAESGEVRRDIVDEGMVRVAARTAWTQLVQTVDLPSVRTLVVSERSVVGPVFI
ncbi:hypothetical protein [Microbacterium sp. SORGH_AS_0888]|uniref:hypothetical protein n=1 Tax=Microbacterium sp. SORGH_AS_0888 TaxID=3041791 RepID=UPI0027D7F4C7|nr:hypothetical protein [Microbacterium sp. SORGH_AS_0888]